MTQVEVLAIDEGLSMAHLKGTLLDLMRRLFGGERRDAPAVLVLPVRRTGRRGGGGLLRLQGAGCRTCHDTGWIEMGGAGMVHPEILENMGIDSERYTGFAAGMGTERLAMQLLGVDDIREFYKNDLRVLQQF